MTKTRIAFGEQPAPAHQSGATAKPADTGAPRTPSLALPFKVEAEPVAAGLHIVATPIGNLRDISLRALVTLASVDAVLAEDTRVSRTLMSHYGLTTPLIAYHEHNAEAMRPRILARLKAGGSLALISDAGTPLVSDPGYKLVEALVGEGIGLTCAPGASALLAALVLAGLPTDRFFFEGFLPPRPAARRARLQELGSVPGTLVFYESPRRLSAMLTEAAALYGPRQAAVARELTKFYETVRRGSLAELAGIFADEETPRGEIVVLIGPPAAGTADHDTADGAIDAGLRAALAKLTLKEAVAQVTAATGQPRRRVYARALELTRKP